MPQAQRARRVVVTLALQETLVAAAGVVIATWPVSFPCRLIDCALSLSGTGTGAGNNDVDVRKDGVSVFTGGRLTIAGGASGKDTSKKPNVGVVGHPNGVPLKVGSKVTATVEAIPATTAGTRGQVLLTLAVTDV